MKKASTLLQQQSSSQSQENNSTSLPNKNEVNETEIVSLEKTPFYLVKTSTQGKWKIVIGNNMVTAKTFRKKWQARLYITMKPWQLIAVTAIILANKSKI